MYYLYFEYSGFVKLNLDYALEFVTASPDCSAYREVLLVQENQALWIPMAIGRKVK